MGIERKPLRGHSYVNCKKKPSILALFCVHFFFHTELWSNATVVN